MPVSTNKLSRFFAKQANRRVRLVYTICKYSNTLQFIYSLNKTVIIEVSRRRFWDVQQVVFPEYVTKFHQNIYDVDRGDQFSNDGISFSSEAHF